jgi:hypothetical protein
MDLDTLLLYLVVSSSWYLLCANDGFSVLKNMHFVKAEKPSLNLASFWLVPLSVAAVVLNFVRTRSGSRSWGYIHLLLYRMMTLDSLSLHHHSFLTLKILFMGFLCTENFKHTLGV